MIKVLLLSFLLFSAKNQIYLTIDDGPSSITDEICDILKKHSVKATFFVLGQNVKRYPNMLKRIYNDGHLIANHTYSHINFYKRYNKELIIEEIKKTENLILDLISYKTTYLRYPYGYYSKQGLEIAKSLGYKVVNWDFGYDWNSYEEDKILQAYLKNLREGQILLIHDNPKRNKMVLRILEKILEEAQRRGFVFVRLDERY